MTCGKCGYRIPEDSDFCPYCGSRIERGPQAAPAPAPAAQPYRTDPAADESKHASRQKKKRRMWKILLLVLVLGLLGVLFWRFGLPGLGYLHAKNLLSGGDYDGAYTAFQTLGSFGDAQEMCLEVRYQQAAALRGEKKFDQANPIFRQLGDYKDSKQLIHEHDYKETVEREPSCRIFGSLRKTCACGDTYTQEIPALGHKLETVSKTASTCTTPGQYVTRCKRCGRESTQQLELAAHSPTTKVTKAATCTATGTEEQICSVCGKVLGTGTIKAKGHTYAAATCTKPKTCKTCGSTSGSALGHTDDLYCTRCGEKTAFYEVWEGQGSAETSRVALAAGEYSVHIRYDGRYEFSARYYSGESSQPVVFMENEKGPLRLSYTLTVYSDRRAAYFEIDTPMDNCMWSLSIKEEK